MKLRGYFVEEYWRRKKIRETDSTSVIRFEERTITHILRRMHMLSYDDRRLVSLLYNEWIEVEVNVVLQREKDRKLREERMKSMRSASRQSREEEERNLARAKRRQKKDTASRLASLRAVDVRRLRCSVCKRTLMDLKQKDRHEKQCKGPRRGYEFSCFDCLNKPLDVKRRVFFPSQTTLQRHRESNDCCRPSTL